jgi:hypothetical protein
LLLLKSRKVRRKLLGLTGGLIGSGGLRLILLDFNSSLGRLFLLGSRGALLLCGSLGSR